MSGVFAVVSNSDDTLNIFAALPDICASVWGVSPSLSPEMVECLNTIISPSAFKELHYRPDSFGDIFTIPRMRFSNLPIFKYSGGSFFLLESAIERQAFAPSFEQAQITISRNRADFQFNSQTGNTHDIQALENMSLALVSRPVDGRHGFYPYFSSVCGDLWVFFFFHSALNRIALVASPDAGRAMQFVIDNGKMHALG